MLNISTATGKIKPFKKCLKDTMCKNQRNNKPIYLSGDFNLNILDYETNPKIKNFMECMQGFIQVKF